MTKKRTYQFGILAEKIAILLLILKGYKILEWRYKTRFGEIDVVAKKSNVIVAIEVKARRSRVLIEEVLHTRQINRIKMAAQFFISQNLQFQNCDLRFDFIEINKFFIPKHHKNFIS